MHAMAVRDDADIVIGKVVGHGKSVPRNLFRRNRTGVDLEWEALIWLLTPHKLFRRAFLNDHDLRFPEGRRRLEDHVFLMRAYFEQPRISVLADYPCYHWVLRDRDVNASWGHLDPPAYFAFMAEVLDVIDANTEPGPFRDRLYARWYRGKMLNRVEKVHGNPDLAVRRGLYETMHEVAVARIPESVDAFVPFNLQARSRLLRAGDFDALAALADTETALRAQVRAAGVTPGETAELTIRAELEGLRFARDGERITWQGADATAGARRGQHRAAAAQAPRDAGGVPGAGHGDDRAGRRSRRRPRGARPARAASARRRAPAARRSRPGRGRCARSSSSPASAPRAASCGRAGRST